MKPEFPALSEAIKLVRRFADIGLMRKFASLMDGITLINSEGLKELNPKMEEANKAIDIAEEEALRVSQQANELTQRFYYEQLVDFSKISIFKDYSPAWLDIVNLIPLDIPIKRGTYKPRKNILKAA